MRALNKIERSVLETLLDIMNSDKNVDHRNINLAKVIFDHSGANHITWGGDNIMISKNNPNGLKSVTVYRNLIDVIYIIQQMSDNGYILLVKDVKDNICLKREKDTAKYDHSTYLGLGQTLKILSNSFAFPTSKLVDFIDNKFQTEEQIQFKRQLCQAKLQTYFALAAFVIAVITLLVTLCK